MIGFVGCLHPEIMEQLDIVENVYISEIMLDELVDMTNNVVPKFRSFSVYPFVYKDLSLLVDKNIFSEDIRKYILSYNSLIDNCLVFDLFEDEKIGAGKVSLAFRIYFSHKERTLTDEETNSILAELVKDIEKKFNAKLR
jgi:phenylalanyl-tRNA synthetase beta chain